MPTSVDLYIPLESSVIVPVPLTWIKTPCTPVFLYLAFIPANKAFIISVSSALAALTTTSLSLASLLTSSRSSIEPRTPTHFICPLESFSKIPIFSEDLMSAVMVDGGVEDVSSLSRNTPPMYPVAPSKNTVEVSGRLMLREYVDSEVRDVSPRLHRALKIYTSRG